MTDWIKTGISIVGFIILLMVLGSAFRSYTLFFVIVWFFLPLVGFIGRHQAFLSLFSRKGITLFRGFLTTVAVLIAFVLFANYENLRDQFGERYIQGYQVTYYTDSDDYGRPTRESDIHAHNFSAQVFLWLAQWVLIAFCIGVPILTWKVSSIAVAALENQKIKDDKF